MKKLDQMLLRAFLGPFILTFCVVVFIFLMQVLTLYLNDIVGKDIGFVDYLKIFFYFSLISIPRSMPLAILLSSLITFGNLGEFYELTAIKSSGISTWRAMRSVFIVAILITVGMYFYNDRVAPWANLKGYSLLYDIKTSKTTLNIKEGVFYNDIPGYRIKVAKKYPDGKTLKNLVIYRHDLNNYDNANQEIILADSGIMQTINNKAYLVFELFKGNQYKEGQSDGKPSGMSGNSLDNTQLTRSHFDQYKMVVSLASFGMQRTDENQFKYHQYMKTTQELTTISDSLKRGAGASRKEFYERSKSYYSYSFKEDFAKKPKMPKYGKWIDSLYARKNKEMTEYYKGQIIETAISNANNVLNYIQSQKMYVNEKDKQVRDFMVELHHKFSASFACLVMFLIGAPLGAIIKKGGFGLPVLVGIVCFILTYVVMIQGDKWAKEGLVWLPLGVWLSNLVSLVAGVYFVNRAVNDSRIFDKDVYIILWAKLRAKWQKKRV